MSVISRGRRIRYDNIVAGSATGPERTVAGNTVSPRECQGGGTMTSTSTNDVWKTNILVGVSTSDGVSVDQLRENIVVNAADSGDEHLTSN